MNNLRGVITQLSSEIASLKASVDNNAKAANAQFAKIADRVFPEMKRRLAAHEQEAVELAGAGGGPCLTLE